MDGSESVVFTNNLGYLNAYNLKLGGKGDQYLITLGYANTCIVRNDVLKCKGRFVDHNKFVLKLPKILSSLKITNIQQINSGCSNLCIITSYKTECIGLNE